MSDQHIILGIHVLESFGTTTDADAMAAGLSTVEGVEIEQMVFGS